MQKLHEVYDYPDKSLCEILMRMESSIEAFSRFTSIPVTLFSSTFKIIWEFNKPAKFCITNDTYENSCSNCRSTLAESMKRAASTNEEIDTFICHTGLWNICYVLRYEGKILGYFIAGPVAMGRNKEETISDFYEKVSKEKINIPLLMTMTNNLNVYTPDDVVNLSKIFKDIILSSFISKQKYNNKTSKLNLNEQLPSLPEIEYNGKSNVVYNALLYINNNYSTITHLSEISDYVHVSKSYFSSLFKKEVGVSIVDYFNNIRLTAAKWALENTDKDITDIAFSVGYRESSYFSKLFKQKFGINPRDYRKNIISK